MGNRLCVYCPLESPPFRLMLRQYDPSIHTRLKISTDPLEQHDAIVIYDDVVAPVQVTPGAVRLLFTGEPASVKTYSSRYLSQFDIVVTAQERLKHHGKRLQQTALPWFVGAQIGGPAADTSPASASLSIAQLAALDMEAPRQATIVAIASGKVVTRFHRKRLDFVKRLADLMDEDSFALYGRDHRPFESKLEILGGAQYHLVLENNLDPHCWTEKLSDCYIAGCFPFYVGPSNVKDYFPAGSFLALNVDDPKGAALAMRRALHECLYEKSALALQAARDLAMHRYNFFSELELLLCESRRSFSSRSGAGSWIRPGSESFSSRLRRRIRASPFVPQFAHELLGN